MRTIEVSCEEVEFIESIKHNCNALDNIINQAEVYDKNPGASFKHFIDSDDVKELWNFLYENEEVDELGIIKDIIKRSGY